MEEQHENFVAAGRKSEKLAATKVKMSGSEKKKVNKNTYDISSIKRVTRKFLGSFTMKSCKATAKKFTK